MSKLDEEIAQIQALRTDLRDRLAKVEEILRKLTEIRSKISELGAESTLHFVEAPKTKEEKLRTRSVSHLKPVEIASAAYRVIESAGKPMKRRDIADELERLGMHLPGTDRTKNLGTILWRNPNKFVAVGKLGYWIRDRALPGVYEPAYQNENGEG
jgi:uncharacterized protein YicC (UPF0701 family)